MQSDAFRGSERDVSLSSDGYPPSGGILPSSNAVRTGVADEEVNVTLGIILTVIGVIALVVTYVRGPNLGLPRRTGYVAGVVLLVVGVALLISTR